MVGGENKERVSNMTSQTGKQQSNYHEINRWYQHEVDQFHKAACGIKQFLMMFQEVSMGNINGADCFLWSFKHKRSGRSVSHSYHGLLHEGWGGGNPDPEIWGGIEPHEISLGQVRWRCERQRFGIHYQWPADLGFEPWPLWWKTFNSLCRCNFRLSQTKTWCRKERKYETVWKGKGFRASVLVELNSVSKRVTDPRKYSLGVNIIIIIVQL